MAREGAKVAVTDLDDAQGKAVVEEIRAQGGEAAFWHLDVASEAEVRKVFGEVESRFGPITALVANAGISGGGNDALDGHGRGLSPARPKAGAPPGRRRPRRA